jgi:hypothetical protein
VLVPLPDESDFVEGPFLLPGAPLTPTELSEGVRACFPVSTPGSAFGAKSAAITGAATKSVADAVAAIRLRMAFPLCVLARLLSLRARKTPSGKGRSRSRSMRVNDTLQKRLTPQDFERLFRYAGK